MTGPSDVNPDSVSTARVRRTVARIFLPVFAAGVVGMWLLVGKGLGLFLGGLACLLFAGLALTLSRAERDEAGVNTPRAGERALVALSVVSMLLGVALLVLLAINNAVVTPVAVSALIAAGLDGLTAAVMLFR